MAPITISSSFSKKKSQKWHASKIRWIVVLTTTLFALGLWITSLASFRLADSGKNNEQYPGLAKNTVPNNKVANVIYNKRKFPCIDKESPSATEIQRLLTKERRDLKIHRPKNAPDNADYDYFKDMGILYELVYAFVAEFQKNDIPIFLAFGSHIGACRHHGIIPFGEKDVDFALFSLDHEKNKAIIHKVLAEKGFDKLSIKNTNFGYNVLTALSHYFDFWLFEQREAEVQCMGWSHGQYTSPRKEKHTGCADWYRRFHNSEHEPPVFPVNKWFPPIYQMFGSHKVPIPSTSNDIDIHYSGGHWSKFCGDIQKSRPDSERLCSNQYGDYPFVFIQDGGTEELRQGSVILHQSPIAVPIADTSVYSKKNPR